MRNVLFTAVWVGLTDLVLVAASRADEAAAVKAVEKLGGKVRVDHKRPGNPVVEVDLSHVELSDAGLKELREFKNLQALIVRKVTDTGLKELKGLMTLQSLHLDACEITDTGLQDLRELKRLQTLSIAGTLVTDAG